MIETQEPNLLAVIAIFIFLFLIIWGLAKWQYSKCMKEYKSGSRMKDFLTEGPMKKGGINKYPTTKRPPKDPKGQGGISPID